MIDMDLLSSHTASGNLDWLFFTELQLLARTRNRGNALEGQIKGLQ